MRIAAKRAAAVLAAAGIASASACQVVLGIGDLALTDAGASDAGGEVSADAPDDAGYDSAPDAAADVPPPPTPCGCDGGCCWSLDAGVTCVAAPAVCTAPSVKFECTKPADCPPSTPACCAVTDGPGPYVTMRTYCTTSASVCPGNGVVCTTPADCPTPVGCSFPSGSTLPSTVYEICR